MLKNKHFASSRNLCDFVNSAENIQAISVTESVEYNGMYVLFYKEHTL